MTGVQTCALPIVSSAIGKHFTGQAEAAVTIAHEGSFYRADCTLHLGPGANLQSKGQSVDPYKAANEAIENLEKRVRRYARKLKSHHRDRRSDD